MLVARCSMLIMVMIQRLWVSFEMPFGLRLILIIVIELCMRMSAQFRVNFVAQFVVNSYWLFDLHQWFVHYYLLHIRREAALCSTVLCEPRHVFIFTCYMSCIYARAALPMKFTIVKHHAYCSRIVKRNESNIKKGNRNTVMQGIL